MSDRTGSANGLIRALRRKWQVVVVIAVLTTAGAVAMSLQQSPVYRSTAKILIADRDLSSLVAGVPDLGVQADVATEVQIAQLPSVIEGAKLSIGRPDDPIATQARVSLHVAANASTSGDSHVIDVRADSEDRRYAAALATAVAQQYVDFRRDISTRPIRSARDDLARRIQQLERDGQANGSLYTQLNARLQQLDTLVILGSSRADVLERGQPATRIAPEPVRSGVLGLLVGLLAGVLAAVAADRIDSRVRSGDEVAEVLAVPVIGELPSPDNRGDDGPSLVARSAPASASAEAFRMLRSHVKFALAAHGGRSLVVTSARPGEGKSFAAANLAVSAAAAGDDVILVDLDLRKPNLHHYLDLPSFPGLSDVVAGDVELRSALMDVPLHEHFFSSGRLRFLAAGRQIPNPGEFVASEGVARLLGQLRAAEGPLVLIDSPPMLLANDATALADHCDATVLVVRMSRTSRRSLQRLRDLLLSGAHRPIGVILTGALGRRQKYYGDAYRGQDAAPVTDQAAGLRFDRDG